MNNEILVVQEKRLCEVSGETGYFHCWEQFMSKDKARVFAIVELGDRVERVDISRLRFVDMENVALRGFNEFKQKGKDIHE